MNKPSHDPSIAHEPHLRGRKSSAADEPFSQDSACPMCGNANFTPDGRCTHCGEQLQSFAPQFVADSSEAKSEKLVRAARYAADENSLVEHSVWDEPGLSPQLSDLVPADGLTYSNWLEQKISQTHSAKTWWITLGIALAAGPWAILGAMLGWGATVFGIVMIVLVGPVTEEIMKIALALWVIEKRPFLFRSRTQIAICALMGGLLFAAVENLIYLNVYFPEPSPTLVRWRWSVCVAMHMGCSLVASLGLMRIWSRTIAEKIRPELNLASPYIISAVIIHGIYNSFAVLLAMMDFQF